MYLLKKLFGFYEEPTPVAVKKTGRRKWTRVRYKLDNLATGSAITITLPSGGSPATFRVVTSSYGAGTFKTKRVAEGKYLVLRKK